MSGRMGMSYFLPLLRRHLILLRTRDRHCALSLAVQVSQERLANWPELDRLVPPVHRAFQWRMQL